MQAIPQRRGDLFVNAKRNFEIVSLRMRKIARVVHLTLGVAENNEEHNMKIAAPPIPFAGSQLNEVRHVCAFFNSDDERYRVLLPFIKDGFEHGDKAIHVVSPDQHCHHLQRLAAVGIDPQVVQHNGQLDLRTTTETYLRDGRFDQDRMLEVFEQLASSTVREGFRRSRIVCHMEWAADDPAHVDNLVEFEARVNDVWCRHDDAVVCVYDLAKFGGATVVDIIRTHPMIIIGGILQQNPFFVPPGQFLRELRDRRTPQTAPSSTVI
jgi:hypothetical protein